MPAVKVRPGRAWWWCGLVLLLAACGGGGGGGGADTTPVDDSSPRTPLPTVARDDNPTAPRMAVGPDDYLPGAGATAVFDRLDSAGTRLGQNTLQLVWQGADALMFTETEETGAAQTTQLQRGADGWEQVGIPGSPLPEPMLAALGRLLLLPSPFHAIGTTRVQYRSGSYGVDLDGDGVVESFRFEYRQTMVGEEQLAGPQGPITALHIRDELLLTVVPSRRSQPELQASATSDIWLAKGLGHVREQVRSVGSEGRDVFPPYTLSLASLRVGGVDALDPGIVRDVRSIALVHRDLVYDAARRRYYASVPGTVVGQGNRVASIDADTGAVSWSGVVGSDPGALALAGDGASLYVGLDGSSEVLRLALPGMTELSRTALPSGGFGGPLVAQTLAASPTAPGTVAVAMAYTGISPAHAGVALVRDGVLAPVQTPGHTGANRIVFGADGSSLFGINTESTEFGLRRLLVQPDGLVVDQVVTDAFASFYTPAIDRIGTRLVLANRIYDAATLAPLGRVSSGADCRVLAATMLGCMPGVGETPGLLLVDPVTAVITTRLTVLETSGSSFSRVVAGPSGQVALRDQINHPAQSEAGRVLLLRHPALP